MKFKNESKKQYIIKKDNEGNELGNTEPVLVINRGNGNGKYHFNYCLINETGERKYLLENHISKNYDINTEVNNHMKIYKNLLGMN